MSLDCTQDASSGNGLEIRRCSQFDVALLGSKNSGTGERVLTGLLYRRRQP